MDEVRAACLSPLPYVTNGAIPGKRNRNVPRCAIQVATEPAERHCHSEKRTPSSLYRPIFFLLSISWLLSTVHASDSFSALTITCNGLANVAKQAAVSDLVARQDPHVWVINETKSPHAVRDRITVPGYKKYESPGLRLERGRGGRWGVNVNPRKSSHLAVLGRGHVLRDHRIVRLADGYNYSGTARTALSAKPLGSSHHVDSFSYHRCSVFCAHCGYTDAEDP